jgi:hypothetical protein
MRRRRLLLGVGLMALVSLGLMLPVSIRHPDSVSPEDVGRIVPGMTVGEVEATFGRKADDVWPGWNFDHHVWLGDYGSVWVTFSSGDDRATKAEFNPEWRRPGIADRLRDWLGW